MAKKPKLDLKKELALKQVDMALGDIHYATGIISNTVRTSGLGLAIILYGFIFSKDQIPAFTAHKWIIFAAACCGVLSIILDIAHYHFVEKHSFKHLRELMDEIGGKA